MSSSSVRSLKARDYRGFKLRSPFRFSSFSRALPLPSLPSICAYLKTWSAGHDRAAEVHVSNQSVISPSRSNPSSFGSLEVWTSKNILPPSCRYPLTASPMLFSRFPPMTFCSTQLMGQNIVAPTMHKAVATNCPSSNNPLKMPN